MSSKFEFVIKIWLKAQRRLEETDCLIVILWNTLVCVNYKDETKESALCILKYYSLHR